MVEKNFHQVCIIESMSEAETDGKLLHKSFTDVGVEHQFYEVRNKRELEECFEQMVEYTRIETNESTTEVPMLYIHFSAHGNQSGIALASKEPIRWHELGGMLIEFASRANRKRSGYCLQTVCFSSCEGLSAEKMKDDDKSTSPYYAIIGSHVKLCGRDLVTAYSPFYGWVLPRISNVDKGVEAMNDALQPLFKVVGRPK